MKKLHRGRVVVTGFAIGCLGLTGSALGAGEGPPDAAIRSQVADALAANAALANSEIEVRSVENGVVLLEGRASDLGDHLEAARVAATVPGVRHISTRICSPDTVSDLIGDLGMAPSLSEPLAALGSPADTTTSDAWLTNTVRARLLESGGPPARGVNVDATAGEVTLLGKVDSPEDKAAAEAEACRVAGVESVRSLLRVEPPSENELARWREGERSTMRDGLALRGSDTSVH